MLVPRLVKGLTERLRLRGGRTDGMGDDTITTVDGTLDLTAATLADEC